MYIISFFLRQLHPQGKLAPQPGWSAAFFPRDAQGCLRPPRWAFSPSPNGPKDRATPRPSGKPADPCFLQWGPRFSGSTAKSAFPGMPGIATLHTYRWTEIYR